MSLDEEEDDKSGDQLRLAGQQLPTLKKGQEVDISQIMRSQGKTKPPARFTEATLLSAMENPQMLCLYRSVPSKVLEYMLYTVRYCRLLAVL